MGEQSIIIFIFIFMIKSFLNQVYPHPSKLPQSFSLVSSYLILSHLIRPLSSLESSINQLEQHAIITEPKTRVHLHLTVPNKTSKEVTRKATHKHAQPSQINLISLTHSRSHFPVWGPGTGDEDDHAVIYTCLEVEPHRRRTHFRSPHTSGWMLCYL